MSIENLQKKIGEISKAKGISEAEIVSTLEAHLNIVYSDKSYSDDDRLIIDALKPRILLVLYGMSDHKKTVNQYTDYKNLFDMDSVEFSLFETAWDELESEGLVLGKAYEISLTEAGVRKARL